MHDNRKPVGNCYKCYYLIIYLLKFCINFCFWASEDVNITVRLLVVRKFDMRNQNVIKPTFAGRIYTETVVDNMTSHKQSCEYIQLTTSEVRTLEMELSTGGSCFSHAAI